MMTGNMFTPWPSRELARGGERWILVLKSLFCDAAKVRRKTDSKFGISATMMVIALHGAGSSRAQDRAIPRAA